MRNLTIATLALSAALAAAGVARADENVSEPSPDAFVTAAPHPQARATTRNMSQALGYSEGAVNREQVEHIFAIEPPSNTAADTLFLKEGDRGIGSN